MTRPLAFPESPALFGRDPAPGLLAFAPGERSIRTWTRSGAGVRCEEVPFRPFLLLADASLLEGAGEPVELVPLAGEGAFRWLALVEGWSRALRARDRCRERSGAAPGDPAAPYRFAPDPVHQHLLLSGRTSFRGLGFDDLRRLALDLEVVTTDGFEFPSAARPGDRIIAIALADSTGWSHVLSGAEMDEATLLAECGRLIAERDPDTLEGHNIFRFDLEYLEARARRLGVPLAWGRDGSVLRGRPARLQVAERTIAYRRYAVAGRHVVDTWMLAQLYDVAARDLDAYGLKEVARHFGVAAPGRTHVAPEDIPRVFREDPARLMAYARDDVLETLALSAILAPPYFVQAQLLPFDYGTVLLRGNATKVDALLLREHLARRHAVPRPEPPRAVGGGLTAVYRRGVARDVRHVDVASLYPSLMLALGIAPASDRLGVFRALLSDLRDFRLAAKRLAADAGTDAERHLYGAMQQTFKILINSFYGYLGFGPGHWNDFEAANRVTAEGRRVVTALVDRLHALGATVIEVDTDGLYFVDPAGAAGASDEAIRGALAPALPAGIQLEVDGPFPAMLSYKMKNYALLDRTGRLRIKGSGLRSRGLERFQRLILEEMCRLLLTDRRDEIPALVDRWVRDFVAHRVPLRHFVKTETLQDALATYREGVASGSRPAAAPYELALRAARPYQPGDQVSYYVAGGGPRVKVTDAARPAAAWDPAAPDENTAYYVARVRELYAKLRPLIERDGLAPVTAEGPRRPAQTAFDFG